MRRGKWSDLRGSVTVEFALIFPLFVLVMGGIYDLTSYSMVSSKLTRIAGVIGDTVSRHDISRQQLIAIMQTSDEMARPYKFISGGGDVIVTQVTNEGETSDPNNMVISWQQSLGGSVSDFGGVGDYPVDLPGDITVTDLQSMIVTEVSYRHRALFLKSILGDHTLREVSIFAPRSSKMDKLIGE